MRTTTSGPNSGLIVSPFASVWTLALGPSSAPKCVRSAFIVRPSAASSVGWMRIPTSGNGGFVPWETTIDSSPLSHGRRSLCKFRPRACSISLSALVNSGTPGTGVPTATGMRPTPLLNLFNAFPTRSPRSKKLTDPSRSSGVVGRSFNVPAFAPVCDVGNEE